MCFLFFKTIPHNLQLNKKTISNQLNKFVIILSTVYDATRELLKIPGTFKCISKVRITFQQQNIIYLKILQTCYSYLELFFFAMSNINPLPQMLVQIQRGIICCAVTRYKQVINKSSSKECFFSNVTKVQEHAQTLPPQTATMINLPQTLSDPTK